MNHAGGSVTTPRGVIKVSLERRGGKVISDISLPDGVSVEKA